MPEWNSKKWFFRKETSAGEPITSPLVAAIGMGAGMVLSMMLVLLDVKGSLWWGSGFAVVFFYLFVHFIWIWDKTSNLRAWAKIAILLLGGGTYFWMVGKQVLFKYREEHAAKHTLEEKYASIQRLTIHDLYKNDISIGTFKYSNSTYSGRIGGVDWAVESQLYENLEQGAMFVGYYVPSNKRTPQIAEVLIKAVPQVLASNSNQRIETVPSNQTV